MCQGGKLASDSFVSIRKPQGLQWKFRSGCGGICFGSGAIAPDRFAPAGESRDGSGAEVIAFANGGGDTVICIKQAGAFDIRRGGQKIASLLLLFHDMCGTGLAGVLQTERFYWRLVWGTRTFQGRCRGGGVPRDRPGGLCLPAGRGVAGAAFVGGISLRGVTATESSPSATLRSDPHCYSRAGITLEDAGRVDEALLNKSLRNKPGNFAFFVRCRE